MKIVEAADGGRDSQKPLSNLSMVKIHTLMQKHQIVAPQKQCNESIPTC
jgi:hypothetical protein